MEFIVYKIYVQGELEGICPKVFKVSLASPNKVEELNVDIDITVDIPFDDSLSFSKIASLAAARAKVVIAQ